MPWKVATNPVGRGDQPAFPSVVDSTGRPHGEDIVCCPLGNSETVKANAAFIVHAVNSHDELLAALRFYADDRKYHGANCKPDDDEETVAACKPVCSTLDDVADYYIGWKNEATGHGGLSNSVFTQAIAETVAKLFQSAFPSLKVWVSNVREAKV